MRRIFTFVFAIFIFLAGSSNAQTIANKATTTGGSNGKSSIKWTANPFDHQVFIENNGQFDGGLPGNDKVLYAAQLGNVWAYFTTHGIIYRYLVKKDNGEKAKGEDHDKDKHDKPEIHYMQSNWENANATVSVIGEGERSDYYTYAISTKKTIKAGIFNKIIYRNIYPGIDIEYSFRKGQDGFEYSLIVHPGADVSKALLKHDKAGKLKLDGNGDMNFSSAVGDFTEHAPAAKYLENGGNLGVILVIKDNAESFSLDANYDKTKTVVIDPWVTNPLFVGSYDRAYDICYDYFGNVYAYGGQAQYQLVKFNRLGAIQWTFTTSPFLENFGYYGDFAVDRRTGTSYATSGFWEDSAQVVKVNTLGVMTAYYVGSYKINEMWRAAYNPCYDNIIIGAGGTGDTNQACMLDTNLVNIVGVDFLHVQSSDNDIALICVDPSGLYCYMATVQISGNVFSQLPLPTLSPTAYIKPDHFDFQEDYVPKYIDGDPTASGAMNGMAASPSWLYLYNGRSLEQYNKNTGVLHDSIAVSTAEEEWGGIDVDACDDIYLGCQDSIKYYDGSLALQGSITMSGDVYDLTLGLNNLMYVAGNGYVSEVAVPNPPSLISSAYGSPSSCSACDGVATVNVNCGIAPYSYKWSNGSTNLTDTGMCAGIYTVKVSDGSCPPRTDSAIVIISGKVGYTASVRDTNPGCALFRGNITAYPTGGAPPYSYLWSNGETNQEDTGLVAGTYTCTITDNTGCKTFVLVTLINPDPPVVSVKPILDSICLGSSIKLTASGGTTYSWTPALGLSCNNCAVPTASPTITTTYKVIGMDTNGCKDSALSTIKVFPVPKPIITGRDTVCSGFEDTLSATGGLTYKWSNNATTSTIHYLVANTQTITVTAYDGMCSHDTTFVIHTINPAAKITASKDSICKGDSVLLSGSGGSSYKWNTGSTATTIWVSPITTKTYTLYAYGPTCHDSAMIKIKIISPITATVSISQDSICPGGSTTITATGSGGQTTYRWNTGQTSSSIMVQDTVTRIYTVTAYGLCDSVQKTMTVTVIPFAKPIISGTLAKCKGQRDTLTVTNSVNPATYVWSDGKTTTTIYTGNINADSTFYVTAYNSLHCPVTDTFHVKVKPYPTASISYPPGCGTTITPVKVTPSGTGPFSYKWNTGSTNDTIDIFINADTSTYTVIVTADGCPISKTVTVLKYFPLLNACCDANIYVGDSTNLNASGANLVKYKWIPDSAINCDTCANIVATPTVTTTYTVIGTDSAGCETERTVTITVETPCFNLVIPNVFTPSNGGALGLDKVFYIKTKNIDSWSLQIYDRWGKEMYTSTNPDEYWDGTTKGGSEASAGVYYYIISGTCQNNTYKKAGFVQLIR